MIRYVPLAVLAVLALAVPSAAVHIGEAMADTGSGSAIVDAGPGSGSAVPAPPPSSQLHDPVSDPVSAWHEVISAKTISWMLAIGAVLVMAAKLLSRLGGTFTFLNQGRVALGVGIAGVVAATAYDALLAGGSWLSVLVGAVMAGLAWWQSHKPAAA